jgi:trans-aconitate methyltransferase
MPLHDPHAQAIRALAGAFDPHVAGGDDWPAKKMAESSYDDIPYLTVSFSESHPRRMQAVARLFGLDAPAPAACRVLELGCAVGGNVVPMAYSLPSAKFVGIDLSESQIAHARAFADAVGTTNIDLRAASITEVTPDWGKFDYIICHGVFSWVPKEVQEKTLQICGAQLSDRGVAYISFNVLPGWHSRTPVRDAMLFHTEGMTDPVERARAGRDFILALVESPALPPDKLAMLQSEVRYLQGKPESYILHEYLETSNEPMYFRDFAGRAARHGLQYLGDAKHNVALDPSWPAAQPWIEKSAGDVVKLEQYADFVHGRMFRRALLCRAEATLDRAGAAGRVEGMFAESLLRQWAAGAGATRFEHPSGARYVTQSPIVRQALSTLSSRFPQAVPVRELAAAADRAEVTQALLQCWTTALIRLYVDPPVYPTQPGDRPRATAVARHLVAGGQTAINLRHETTTLAPPQRSLVPFLDGTRDRDQLARESGLSRDLLDQTLAQLAFSAVLEA